MLWFLKLDLTKRLKYGKLETKCLPYLKQLIKIARWHSLACINTVKFFFTTISVYYIEVQNMIYDFVGIGRRFYIEPRKIFCSKTRQPLCRVVSLMIFLILNLIRGLIGIQFSIWDQNQCLTCITLLKFHWRLSFLELMSWKSSWIIPLKVIKENSFLGFRKSWSIISHVLCIYVFVLLLT